MVIMRQFKTIENELRRNSELLKLVAELVVGLSKVVQDSYPDPELILTRRIDRLEKQKPRA